VPIVELLQSHHDRATFDCGNTSLNNFLRHQARQNMDRNVGVTHVVVEAAGETKILGYYTLVTRTIDRDIIPAKGLPSGAVGVVLLASLAVDIAAQRRGLGKRMLLRSMKQTLSAATEVGVFALVVNAIDESAKEWYLGLDWGFVQLLDNPHHLYISIKTLKQLEF
jgi:N-acetylglutamate synthase-like GNAT family acetyltransferase